MLCSNHYTAFFLFFVAVKKAKNVFGGSLLEALEFEVSNRASRSLEVLPLNFGTTSVRWIE